jgi:hypothetical protein
MAIIKIRGVLVDILVEIAPDVYKKYTTKDKKRVRQLLVQCQNAFYGTMVASLLYYRKFTKSLTQIGFEINPYDPCVMNKMIEGKQMTICFHVDDCKLSHRKSKVMDKMFEWLRQEYERGRIGANDGEQRQGPHVSRNDVGLHRSWSSEDHDD